MTGVAAASCHADSGGRAYGQEVIDILLQVMEKDRDKLVVIWLATRTGWTSSSSATPG